MKVYAVIEYRRPAGGFMDFLPDYGQAEEYARRRCDVLAEQNGGLWVREDDLFILRKSDGEVYATLTIREVVPGMSFGF